VSSHGFTPEKPTDPRGRTVESDPLPTSRSRDVRAVVSLILLIIDVSVLVMTMAGEHGPLRFVLGLVFGVVVPGWSIVGLLRLDNAALEIGLSVAVSLALLLVVAQILMTVHLWHLGALEMVMCLACIPSLVRQLSWHRNNTTGST